MICFISAAPNDFARTNGTFVGIDGGRTSCGGDEGETFAIGSKEEEEEDGSEDEGEGGEAPVKNVTLVLLFSFNSYLVSIAEPFESSPPVCDDLTAKLTHMEFYSIDFYIKKNRREEIRKGFGVYSTS